MSEKKTHNRLISNAIQLKLSTEVSLHNNLKSYNPQNFTSIINNPKVSYIINLILDFIHWGH